MCYETTLVTCRKMKMITLCAFLCAFMRYDTNIEKPERIKSEVSKIYSRK